MNDGIERKLRFGYVETKGTRSDRAKRNVSKRYGSGLCDHCGQQMRHGECPFCEPEGDRG